ncbi:mask [Symbiodinium microadriaticum]|nr:mask [Symbiodinium microadriaticum]
MEISSKFNTSPLLAACSGCYVDIARMLVEAGATTDSADTLGVSPLLAACRHGSLELVSLLLRARATTNIVDRDGTSPLLVACKNNQIGIARLLIAARAEPDISNRSGEFALLLAADAAVIAEKRGLGGPPRGESNARRSRSELLRLLLDASADLDKTDGKGMSARSALAVACEKGDVDVARLLLQRGARQKGGEWGKSPLLLACQNGHGNVVQMLLEARAALDCTHGEASPLLASCENGHWEVVELLLRAGVGTETSESSGISPLIAACERGRLRVVEVLLASGAAKESDARGISPLLAASEIGHMDLVSLLIFERSDLDHVDRGGRSPLLAASLNGHSDVVRLLLASAADHSKQDIAGTSPLLAACSMGSLEIVQALLTARADVHLANHAGESPLQLALQRDFTQIAACISSEDMFYFCNVSSGGAATKVIGRSQTLSVEVGITTVLSFTVYECPEPVFTPETARCLGLLRVPVERLAERYSSGIFQQWFNLDTTTDPRMPAGDLQSLVSRFEQSYADAVADVYQPKICLSVIGTAFEVQRGTRQTCSIFVGEDVKTQASCNEKMRYS